MLEVCTCHHLPVLPEASVQLSRCHTCQLEARQLLRLQGQPSSGVEAIPEGGSTADDDGGEDEVFVPACPAACACAQPAAADGGACHACVHPRGSSQENDAANVGGGHTYGGPGCCAEQASEALGALHVGEAAVHQP